jgi:hypothetical protein
LTRLPCDDRKVADTIVCRDFFVYCTDPSDRVDLRIKGAAEIWGIDMSCEDFLNKYSMPGQFNWNTASQDLYKLSPNDFQAKYGKAMDLTGVEAQDFKYADLTYKMQT